MRAQWPPEVPSRCAVYLYSSCHVRPYRCLVEGRWGMLGMCRAKSSQRRVNEDSEMQRLASEQHPSCDLLDATCSKLANMADAVGTSPSERCHSNRMGKHTTFYGGLATNTVHCGTAARVGSLAARQTPALRDVAGHIRVETKLLAFEAVRMLSPNAVRDTQLHRTFTPRFMSRSRSLTGRCWL
jgi:hypothetical protein